MVHGIRFYAFISFCSFTKYISTQVLHNFGDMKYEIVAVSTTIYRVLVLTDKE